MDNPSRERARGVIQPSMELRRDLLAQEIYIGYAIDLRFDPSILIPPTTGKRRSMTGHFRVTGAAYSLIAFSFSNAWKKNYSC